MQALLNTVNEKLQYTSFKEERLFLQELKRRILANTSTGQLEAWISDINNRSYSPRFFSSVHTCSTELLNDFFI